ncbi:MAG: ribonuclease III [Clostridia bacterium]|nr:ribonuclease III [Clostridia bacterium]
MEKMFANLKNLTKTEAKCLNPQVLAFVGDSVYTLFVRTMLAEKFDVKSGKLHTLANEYVKAGGQSDALERVISVLTDAEMGIYKRARNYKTHSVAKNADVVDYKRATGFEAVVGYLYLIGDYARLNELLKLCVEGENNEG